MEVQVWSDFACPWCALGLARLDVARREFEHGDQVQVVHRSYELHPRARATSDLNMVDAIAAKYGTTAERVRVHNEHLTMLGRDVGLELDFERVRLGSTFGAHRLAHAARGTDGEEVLLRGLFRAYFTEGRLLSDHGVLRVHRFGQIGPSVEQGGAVEWREQPLVGIDDERVGTVEPGEDPPGRWCEESRGPSIGTVDVEPQRMLRCDVGYSVEVVHDSCVRRPGGGDHTDRVGSPRGVPQGGRQCVTREPMVRRRHR